MKIIEAIKQLSNNDLKEIILYIQKGSTVDGSLYKNIINENKKQIYPLSNLDLLLELLKEGSFRWIKNNC